MYIYTEETPITSAGIYHNEELGLISLSSDGSNWITIADKNLGSTKAGADPDSYGYYYQRGNNYGFTNQGTVTTSSTAVNAGTYGPTNYYTSSTFITATPRDSSNNDNLRGDTTNTNVARKGPCDIGFHIPSQTEAQSLIDTLNSIVGGKKLLQFEQYLFMGKTQVRSQTNGNVVTPSSTAYYQTSTQYSNNVPYTIRFGASTDGYVGGATSKAQGFPIRPFKNTPVQPRTGGEWVFVLRNLSWFIDKRNNGQFDVGKDELNKYSTEYFDKFLAEGNLTWNGLAYILNGTGYYYYESSWGYD